MKLLFVLIVSTLASIAYAEDPLICGDQLVQTYVDVISKTLDGTEGNAVPFMINHYERVIETMIRAKYGNQYGVVIIEKYVPIELPPNVKEHCHVLSKYYVVYVTKSLEEMTTTTQQPTPPKKIIQNNQ